MSKGYESKKNETWKNKPKMPLQQILKLFYLAILSYHLENVK